MGNIKQLAEKLGIETKLLDLSLDFQCIEKKWPAFGHIPQFTLKIYNRKEYTIPQCSVEVPIDHLVKEALSQVDKKPSDENVRSFSKYLKFKVDELPNVYEWDISKTLFIGANEEFSGIDIEDIDWDKYAPILEKLIEQVVDLYMWADCMAQEWVDTMERSGAWAKEKDNGNN